MSNILQSSTIVPNNKYPSCAYAKKTIINITLNSRASLAQRIIVADNCVSFIK